MKALRIFISAIVVVAALAYLNFVVLPKPQVSQATTYIQTKGWTAQYWNNCGNTGAGIKLEVAESNSCPNYRGSLQNYTGNVKVSVAYNPNGDKFRVVGKWTSYYCPTQAGSAGCLSNPQSTGSTVDLGTNGSTTFSTVTQNKTCGTVQNDFGFQAQVLKNGTWVNACGAGNLGDLGASNATWTSCTSTSGYCPTTTPTPTVTPTPTPTQIQHMDCVNSACVLVPGSGQNQCSSNAQCLPDGHLIVKKHVVNDDGGTKVASNFTIYVKDVHTGNTMQFPGSETGTYILMAPTQLYTVYEGNHNGYQETFSGACSGMVAKGQTVTCTITNDDEPNVTPTPSPLQHMACQHNACILVPGSGRNQCSQDSDCTVPVPGASCTFSPASQQLQDGQTGTTTLLVSTSNLPQTNKRATICIGEDANAQSYLADTEINYTNYPISVNVTAPHTYTALVYVNDKNTDSHACSGTIVATCAATTTITATPTPTEVPPTPTPTPFGCTSNCGDTIINVTQTQSQQQQQQQAVLAASVAPASNANQLPSTGAGTDVLFGLISLLPIGFKLRKLI